MFQFTGPLADFREAHHDLPKPLGLFLQSLREGAAVQDALLDLLPRPLRARGERLLLNRGEAFQQGDAASQHRGELAETHLDVESRHRLEPGGVPQRWQIARLGHLVHVQHEQFLGTKFQHQRVARLRLARKRPPDPARVACCHLKLH